MARKLLILGATGSIGRQTLDVVRAHRDEFEVIALSAHTRVDELLELIREFEPETVAVHSKEQAERIRSAVPSVSVFFGEDALVSVATCSPGALVVNAVMGAVGIRPTLAALEAFCDVALANKETLVAAGEPVMEMARRFNVHIYPIDSEHSALAQCLRGYDVCDVERLILTASGGPFRGRSRESLEYVTVTDALSHPTWSMGAKITVDSATLMNKGLEVIEAHFLFGVPYSAIDVLVHPQSIVHSMVQFRDGALLAQLGAPDMRVPISYAIFWQEGRRTESWPRLDLTKMSQLTFEQPDMVTFPALSLAYDCGRTGGTLPAVMNAANEVAATSFLQGKIRFSSIYRIVADVVEKHLVVSHPSVEEIFEADTLARKLAIDAIAKRG